MCVCLRVCVSAALCLTGSCSDSRSQDALHIIQTGCSACEAAGVSAVRGKSQIFELSARGGRLLNYFMMSHMFMTLVYGMFMKLSFYQHFPSDFLTHNGNTLQLHIMHL